LEFVFYLFVDEDWKEQSNENINIIWSSDITDNDSLHFKKFDFSQEKDGIYITKLTEDIDWFAVQNPITGKLFFGELSLEDVKNDEFNRTFIVLT